MNPVVPKHGISGTRTIHWVDLKHKHVFLFSDNTHEYHECKDAFYVKRQTIEDYLYAISLQKEADFYLEASDRMDTFEKGSHMRRAYKKFNKPRVNGFHVHFVDERYSTSTINEKVSKISESVGSNFQLVFDMIENSDFGQYKKVLDNEIKILLHKYKFPHNEIVEEGLKVNFVYLIEYYNEHKVKLLKENQRIKKKLELNLKVFIDNDSHLYFLIASMYMVLVDLTFVMICLKSDRKIHLGYFGNMHVRNIIRIFNHFGFSNIAIQGDDNCIPVDSLNETLKLNFEGKRIKSKKNKIKNI